MCKKSTFYLMVTPKCYQTLNNNVTNTNSVMAKWILKIFSFYNLYRHLYLSLTHKNNIYLSYISTTPGQSAHMLV